MKNIPIHQNLFITKDETRNDLPQDVIDQKQI